MGAAEVDLKKLKEVEAIVRMAEVQIRGLATGVEKVSTDEEERRRRRAERFQEGSSGAAGAEQSDAGSKPPAQAQAARPVGSARAPRLAHPPEKLSEEEEARRRRRMERFVGAASAGAEQDAGPTPPAQPAKGPEGSAAGDAERTPAFGEWGASRAFLGRRPRAWARRGRGSRAMENSDSKAKPVAVAARSSPAGQPADKLSTEEAEHSLPGGLRGGLREPPRDDVDPLPFMVFCPCYPDK